MLRALKISPLESPIMSKIAEGNKNHSHKISNKLERSMNYEYSRNENVVAVIWLFNPKIERFAKVLKSIIGQVDKIILVDNNSNNIEHIQYLCESLKRKIDITLLRLRFNSGVHALNLGMKYACEKFNPTWILLLDQDTVVYRNAVAKVLKVLARLNPYIIDRLGALRMSGKKWSNEGGLRLIEDRYGIFSGCLINARIIKHIRIREDFFLDQADFDFFDRIRNQGFLTIVCLGERLIDHQIGTPLSIRVRLPLIGVIESYEPAWRYYYIVRNSTVLLMEGKLDIVFYLRQLIIYAIPLCFHEGIITFLKTISLALAHGLGRKLGYLNPKML